ncbi:hypothetical protein BKN38_09005 [Helicobacter sp. CLO-3]|uniref:ABC transporter ATP-binding protein n=1 Tax=unclassified Helicobacter TaxID=2593540 RepID=UPI0008055016|nr:MULTISPECIES: ABC transporter ATP-binding protein [unclassified Helicobacter]OBV28726.1 hypothetical protein BA723_08315 [Helicobacter sp. CLO-3]OHU81454.1 hypothetical protein BKN38_09005 [Helicobacter sp. CLO-3]
MSFLCVQNLCFARGGRKILHNVDFSLERGEVLSILGSNGAGKTTLLKCMLGLAHATSGARLLESKPIESYGKHIWRKISYVPQAKGNILSLRVLDMVALGLNPMIAFKPNASDYAKANDALARLGVEYLAQKSCCDISGGELQMVLFARALVSEPEILVLDEPESNLDFKNQKIILDLLHSLNKQGCTIIINTHFPAHAIFLSHKALLLKKLEKAENIKKSSGAPCVSGVSNESSAKVADSGADLPISLDSNALFGDAKDILTQENLSALYGVPLHFSALARDRFADKSGFVVSV